MSMQPTVHEVKYTVEDKYAHLMGSFWARWEGDANNSLAARVAFVGWCKERGENPKDFYYRRHIVSGETIFR